MGQQGQPVLVVLSLQDFQLGPPHHVGRESQRLQLVLFLLLVQDFQMVQLLRGVQLDQKVQVVLEVQLVLMGQDCLVALEYLHLGFQQVQAHLQFQQIFKCRPTIIHYTYEKALT